MTYLCIDTSQGADVALIEPDHDGVRVIAHATLSQTNMHAESVTPLITQCCQQAGYATVKQAPISAIIVGRGPAPFTGLRAGLVSAKTLGFALNVDVYGVCALDVIALGVFAKEPGATRVGAITDAKRKEVYVAVYQRSENGMTCIIEPRVTTPAQAKQLCEEAKVDTYAGSGTSLYADTFGDVNNTTNGFDVTLMHAALTNAQANGQDTTDLSPLYLRRPDIHGQNA